MSKRGATLAALVHLLVVLSLVIESEQLPKCLGGKSEVWLCEKLNESVLSPDQVLQCMKKVSGKSKIAIGNTNVEELIQLSKKTRKDCNDAAYEKREEVCQRAKTANNRHIDDYCEDRLTKLTWFCAEHEPHYHGKHINPPVNPETEGYFWSIFKDFGSRILDESEIHELESKYLFAVDMSKAEELVHNCLALLHSRRYSGAIRNPSEQSNGDQLEVDSKGPNWDNAYHLCKIPFERMGFKFFTIKA